MRAAGAAIPALVTLLLGAAPARADLQKFGGQLAVGAGMVSIQRDDDLEVDAPGGSLSFAAGVDYPVAAQWRVGGSVGFHLLGTTNVVSGSFAAAVDYSAFEAALLAHWTPDDLGPLRRVSFGPAVMSARADVSAGAGGASFLPLSVEEVAPAAAASLTLMPGGTSPVRAGLEVGVRVGLLPDQTWTIALARLAVHF